MQPTYPSDASSPGEHRDHFQPSISDGLAHPPTKSRLWNVIDLGDPPAR